MAFLESNKALKIQISLENRYSLSVSLSSSVVNSKGFIDFTVVTA